MINNLDDLRKNIDAIDTAIVCLFAARFRVTEKVGLHKKENNLPVVDKEREVRQMRSVAALAESQGLDFIFVQKILRMTIDEVISKHKKIMNNSDEACNQPSLTEKEGGNI